MVDKFLLWDIVYVEFFILMGLFFVCFKMKWKEIFLKYFDIFFYKVKLM